MKESGAFLGSWLVREYVYNPDGSLAGTVRQRRELARLANGRIRVTQHCQPDPELATHPLGRFTGSPVFELSVEPPYRYYHGPAVVGTAVSWSDGVMTGRGLWPEFGHNFRSFAILATPERQLTGGKFFNASQMVANIAGLALPEETAAGWPTLDGPHWPGELAVEWVGTVETVAVGTMASQKRPLHRDYGPGQSWHDRLEDGSTIQWWLKQDDQRYRILGKQYGTSLRGGRPLQGIGKQFGWMLEIEAITNINSTIELMELFDPANGHVVGLRHRFVNNELAEVEIIRLRPA
jgi:hypothetical protein